MKKKIKPDALILKLVPILTILWLPNIFGQNRKEPGLAKIWPVGNFTVRKSDKGQQVFADRDFVLNKLPDLLRGSEFIGGSYTSGLSFKPVTKGKFFMVTPVRGEPGSQEGLLLEKGFLKIQNSHFKLFKEQKEKVAIFEKEIAGKFEQMTTSGWAVAFFYAKVLPSFDIPANVIWKPEQAFALDTRKWQGCPSLELTEKRLWTAWFSGGEREPDKGNYAVISYSDDNGQNWIDPAMVIAHPDSNVRVMDVQLWTDPKGNLWVFWVQNTGTNWFDGIWGTWAIRIDNPAGSVPQWSTPARLTDGLTRNKVTVLSTGEWLLPSYNWVNNQSSIYISNDQGNSWSLRGGPTNEYSYFFEHMVTELKDGRLWMLQRRMKQSFSNDKGKTWTQLRELPELTSPDSRLFVRRLDSGNLLLVYNNDPEKKTRKVMTAALSEDDGKSWPHSLVLDDRTALSYPDGVQQEDGLIYIAYDRSRNDEKEILMTIFKEEDIKAGKFVSPESVQRKVISRAP